MKRSLYTLFALLVMASLVLTACGGGKSSSPVNKFAGMTYQKVLDFKVYFAAVTPLESKYSAAYDEWFKFVDNGIQQIGEAKFLSDNCYSNVDDILQRNTIGEFDQPSADGSTSGVLDQTKLVSALVTNNLYPANADKCSEMLQETLRQVSIIRTQGYEKYVTFREIRSSLATMYKGGDFDIALQNSFLQQYGVEFISFMNDELAKAGVAKFPADFIGFPTALVTVSTKSVTWTNYYIKLAADIKSGAVASNYSADMYGARWIGPEKLGYGELTRQAAFEFTGQSYLSGNSSTAKDCGMAPSFGMHFDADCNEVPDNSSAPANVPAPTEAIPAEVPATVAP